MEKINELMDMKSEIEDLKIEKAKIEGKQEELEEFFKDEIGVTSDKEIDKEIQKREKEVESLKEHFSERFFKLEKELEELEE